MSRFLAIIILSVATTARAEDWPQWMGPKRDAIWRETGIIDKFPAEGPKVLWRYPIEGGYAGPAVANGRVFVTDFVKKSADEKTDDGMDRKAIDGRERVQCIDAKTGEQKWIVAYDCPYNISYPCGPRCTPT